MRRNILLLLVLILAGCTYQGAKLSSYFKNPRSFIQDPHFSKYKEKRDAIESQYLQREITYAQYVKEMDELDETYAKEVQERNAKISSKH